MNEFDKFSKQAKSMSSNPLGIIALFITLVYGIAALTISFSRNIENYIEPLIYFLIFFPVVVLGCFLWLVTKHYDKIYAPIDFKNEENYVKTLLIASLAAANAKNHGDNDKSIKQLVDLVNKEFSINSGLLNYPYYIYSTDYYQLMLY